FAEADEGLPAVALDGRALEAAAASEDEARFALRPMELGGAPHGLAFTNVEERPAFFALEGIWTEPLGPGDRMARGQRVALHRRFEAADGRELRPGDVVRLGETVRVRLFVYTEGSAPPMVMLHDPMGGGFEAVQSHFATSAQSALQAMLGMGPDDEVVDPRGFHAMRSAGSISHRALERNAAVFYFDQLPSGLQEYTYVVRATAVGAFTLPPAQIEAARDGEFVGRSTVFELRVADGEEARAE
ncbi:MAG TPA: hypothetical protein RMG45_32820, partial [Polyangiaceae bacterium LLY-WYZ-15_(1-7)]|nr:hypothetical protein [Polyangiaceae bacterium LLY-WYZ-15_(1-7)]